MSDSERLVLVGRVAGAFGVKGDVRIHAYGGDPMALLGYGAMLRADGSLALTLLSGRAAKGELIARARELTSKEATDALRGLELYVPRAALPPAEEDEFYLDDLIGLRAEAPDGTALGRVLNVHDFGAGDLLEIAPEGGGPSWLIAFTKANVPQVDVPGGRVVVIRPPETE